MSRDIQRRLDRLEWTAQAQTGATRHVFTYSPQALAQAAAARMAAGKQPGEYCWEAVAAILEVEAERAQHTA